MISMKRTKENNNITGKMNTFLYLYVFPFACLNFKVPAIFSLKVHPTKQPYLLLPPLHKRDTSSPPSP